jgi:hypothetical protein
VVKLGHTVIHRRRDALCCSAAAFVCLSQNEISAGAGPHGVCRSVYPVPLEAAIWLGAGSPDQRVVTR